MGKRFEKDCVFHFEKESFVPLKNILKLSPKMRIINFYPSKNNIEFHD